MFRCDPTLLYLMPAHFGPYAPQRGVGRYLDVTTISIGYVTDRARLERYLPEGFAIRGEPTLVVYYAMNREVEWMAGGSYNERHRPRHGRALRRRGRARGGGRRAGR